MTSMTSRISRLAAAFGVAAVMAGGAATPSLAYPDERQPFVEFDSNGSLLSSNPGYANEALRRGIRGNLYKLYVLLGCAVRINRQSHHDINLALRPFGFKLNQAPPVQNHNDLKLVGMTVVAQRASAISKDVLTQCGTVFAMRIAAKLDRRALMDWCASNAADVDVDAALKKLSVMRALETP